MDNINSGAEPTQRDYQGQIMSALMRFFRVRDVEEFSILMRPDNESSLLLNAVMQKERPVMGVNIFRDQQEVEIEDHNGDVTAVVLPESTLMIEYGDLGGDKGSTVYVWKDESDEVDYGFCTGA